MIKKLAISCFLMFSYVTQAYASEHGEAAASHGDAHQETSGGLPQLDPSSFESQTFWLIVIFGSIYFFFSKKSLPQISQSIEVRAERIKNDLDSAEKLKEEVAAAQASYEECLKKARSEASMLFIDIENDIKNTYDKNTDKFQEHSANKVKELEGNIDKARKSALEEMSQIAAEVATEAAEKIIGIRTDAKSAKAVVNSLNKAA